VPVWWQVRLQVLVIEIEADVPIKLAILVISGIAFDGAPDLFGGFGVPCQGRHAALGANDRGIDAELGPRLGVQDAMRVHEEIADAGVTQDLIDAWGVAAFRQPDALRALAEVAFEFAAADLDLGADGVPVGLPSRGKSRG